MTELYEGKEISGAKELSPVVELSTKGLPQHFVGDRGAKTVLVMLNPGTDKDKADENFARDTARYDRTTAGAFIQSYVAAMTNFGKNHRDDGLDSFDLKQAAFLKPWKESGVAIRQDFPASEDNKTRRDAKKAVLMQKLQLELLPYCSRTFRLPRRFDARPLAPFVETLFDEIFAHERKYVVFAADVFCRVFKAYNEIKGETVVDLTHEIERRPLKNMNGRCQPVLLKWNGREQKAVIAPTFASQALSRAYALMEKYGTFCFEQFEKYTRAI